MHFIFFLEEPSAEATLETLLGKHFGAEHTFQFHVHPGKQHLLKNLSHRLRGYSWALDDYRDAYRFVVLLDRDQDDCLELKARLEELAESCGFATPGRSSSAKNVRLINRIIVAELEAWFLGDPEALRRAFPGLSKTFEKKSAFRNPDSVVNPAKRLEGLLRSAGHYPGGLAKIDAARRIGPHLDPARNRSRSFNLFFQSLQQLTRGNSLVGPT